MRYGVQALHVKQCSFVRICYWSLASVTRYDVTCTYLHVPYSEKGRLSSARVT